MSFDARGGHNRKRVNYKFFDTWSPRMAYVLGLIYADGSLIDASKSSRTQYFKISSKDKSLLKQVRFALGSNHSISVRLSGDVIIHGKKYKHSNLYDLRIGSKKMYKSLTSRSLSTKKSLIMKFPVVPFKYLSYFLRGYFDGDGCLYIKYFKNKRCRLSVIFTSGSYDFLDSLKKILSITIKVSGGGIYSGDGAYRLRYSKNEGTQILNYLYQNLDLAPFLDRKYLKFQEFLQTKLINR